MSATEEFCTMCTTTSSTLISVSVPSLCLLNHSCSGVLYLHLLATTTSASHDDLSRLSKGRHQERQTDGQSSGDRPTGQCKSRVTHSHHSIFPHHLDGIVRNQQQNANGQTTTVSTTKRLLCESSPLSTTMAQSSSMATRLL